MMYSVTTVCGATVRVSVEQVANMKTATMYRK